MVSVKWGHLFLGLSQGLALSLMCSVCDSGCRYDLPVVWCMDGHAQTKSFLNDSRNSGRDVALVLCT